jgi:hypothetical protein
VRTREAFLAVTLALALSACSGNDDGGDAEPNPSEPVSEITVDCDEYDGAAEAIADAQAELYSAPGTDGAIDKLASELSALKEDAPPDIQAALADMEAGFRQAEQFLENPTPETNAKLVALAPTLSAEGEKITAYITSQCD